MSELHAVRPADTARADATRTVCDLPVEGEIDVAYVATLDRARAVGVDCLICLGWLGARHTTPPVVIKGTWFPYGPPSLPGESDAAYTDRLTGAAAVKYLREHGADMPRLTAEDILKAQVPPEVAVPYDHMRNRQCSIGYHDECSDPHGVDCECPCHRLPPEGTVIEIDGGRTMIAAPLGSPDDGPVEKILDEVIAELERARAKFPGQHLPLGFGPDVRVVDAMGAAALRDMIRDRTDYAAEHGHLTWLDVLAEEGFEAFAEDDSAKARAELVQLNAMCLRAILDIDRPQPISFTGPSGVRWTQTGTDPDGSPVMAVSVNGSLTPPPVSGATATDPPEATDA